LGFCPSISGSIAGVIFDHREKSFFNLRERFLTFVRNDRMVGMTGVSYCKVCFQLKHSDREISNGKPILLLSPTSLSL